MSGYTLADGVTLKNKFGESDRERLADLEDSFTKFRMIELQAGLGPSGAFDLDRLKATHRHLFQDAFEWAGRTRDEKVKLSDGEIATELVIRKIGGQPFTNGTKIRKDLDSLFERLARESNLGGLPRDEFATRAAGYFAAVNTAHPFREGNGRTQRAFLEALAESAGHSLDFDVVSSERMIATSIAAHERGDVSGFERMFREIADPQRVAALRQAQQFLDAQKFPWQDRYIATTEEGRPYDLTMVGRGGANFMAHTKEGAIIIGRSRDLPDPAPTSGAKFTMIASGDARQQAVSGESERQKDPIVSRERAPPKPRQKPR